MEVKLYVGNLAQSTTETEIGLLFTQAGKVVSTQLVKNENSGLSKGIAYVTMSTYAEAQKAIELFHAYSLSDQVLTVKATKPRPATGTSSTSSQLSAFSTADRKPKSQALKLPKAPGGYQSKLGAFGVGGGPVGPRRRGGGGSRRH